MDYDGLGKISFIFNSNLIHSTSFQIRLEVTQIDGWTNRETDSQRLVIQGIFVYFLFGVLKIYYIYYCKKEWH